MSTHICMFVRYILKSLAPFPRKNTNLTITAYDVDHCCYQSSNLFPFRLLKSLGKFQALYDSQELNILSKNAFIFNRAWFCIDLAVRFWALMSLLCVGFLRFTESPALQVLKGLFSSHSAWMPRLLLVSIHHSTYSQIWMSVLPPVITSSFVSSSCLISFVLGALTWRYPRLQDLQTPSEWGIISLDKT